MEFCRFVNLAEKHVLSLCEIEIFLGLISVHYRRSLHDCTMYLLLFISIFFVQKKKGIQGVIQIDNPNVVKARTVKTRDIDVRADLCISSNVTGSTLLYAVCDRIKFHFRLFFTRRKSSSEEFWVFTRLEMVHDYCRWTGQLSFHGERGSLLTHYFSYFYGLQSRL